MLSVKTESELHDLSEQLNKSKTKHTVFKEPDIDDAVTALAICPGPEVRKLCQKLPLAMRNI